MTGHPRGKRGGVLPQIFRTCSEKWATQATGSMN